MPTNGAARMICIAVAALLLGSAASAHVRHSHPRLVPDPNLDAALIVDAPTGEVLYARNEDAIRHPASLTKMMTLYVVFDKLRAHKIALDTTFPASAYAASQPRAHLRIHPGETMTVEAAIKALVVCSANDVAVALAEGVAGGEPQFVELMNAKARALGMTHTYYTNASGLPDPQPGDDGRRSRRPGAPSDVRFSRIFSLLPHAVDDVERPRLQHP